MPSTNPHPDVIAEIVRQNRGVYRASPSRLQEDVSQEAQVANDYRGRLTYELLQNADDSMEGQAGHDDRVAFIVTDDELWMANTGRPLNAEDVRGLCGLGASSKVSTDRERRASIGHKGLGFKSVLEITEAPAAFSEDYRFELGAEHAYPHVHAIWEELGLEAPDEVPAMRFPSPIEDIPARWSALRKEGYNTAFRFPFHDDVDAERRRALADGLLNLPLTTVLFLKHLERVSVEVEHGDRRETSSWQIERDRLEGNNWRETIGITSGGMYRVSVIPDDGRGARFLIAHDDTIQIGRHRVGLSGPAWEGVNLTEVSVAVLDTKDDPSKIEKSWRRFHVFLPTEQRSPYPFLVNGAFTTDLSRQQIRVTDDSRDYNAYLVREAARIFRVEMLDFLLDRGTDVALAALERERVVSDDKETNPAGALLHQALRDELAEVPIIPAETGDRLPLANIVVPPPQLGESGSDFRRVLAGDATWNGRSFPDRRFCQGRWSRVAVDHGATPLSSAESLRVLAELVDPQRAKVEPHELGKFDIDPVLELLVATWVSADPEDRESIEETAPQERLFPVHRNEDDTLERVSLKNETAFYPPRAAHHDLPLARLRFLCHDLCWGDLLRQERADVLEDRMKAWTALFDIKEFRFEDVMRAAVLPALALDPDEKLRAELRNLDTIAAICQLAGSLTKPDRPLRYQRLQGDRALFNLARLPLPCRSEGDTDRWEPAYKVYFGRDWIGDDSVETILDSVPPDSNQRKHLADVAFLAPPEEFTGRLKLSREGGSESDAGADKLEEDRAEPEGEDEVGLEEDTDQMLETDEHERWIAFLLWIGVNRALRPIHFHDVEDRAAGWLTTEGLQKPAGWAFRNLGGIWDRFRDALQQQLAADEQIENEVVYLYEAHDLDLIVPLLAIAEKEDKPRVGSALFGHLARHWDLYSDFVNVQLALVPEDKSPSRRTKPQRAKAEELRYFGANLWLHRLQQRAFCPTTHGPRRPDRTWTPSPEVDRRFGRRGRNPERLLPLLDPPDELPPRGVHGLVEKLRIRTEMSPSVFGLDDARLLATRLEKIFTDEHGNAVISATDMRRVIKPVYREMFKLLTGSSGDGTRAPLAKVPLLGKRGDELAFRRAEELLYAKNPGTRARSGIGASVPLFVLEAEATATAPLTNLFGVRTVEDVLAWRAQPGSRSLDGADLNAFRDRLRSLLVPLLARIRAERSDPRDTRLLSDFVETIEPVDELLLSAQLDEEQLHEVPDRLYFVSPPSRDNGMEAYIVWDGAPWPPTLESAQALAMAMADLLGINLVETFLTFILSDTSDRMRLLDIAGATSYLDEIRDELQSEISPEESIGTPSREPAKSAPETSDKTETVPVPPDPSTTSPAPPPVPLVDYDDLVIEGEPLLLRGEGADGRSVETGAGGNGGGSSRRDGTAAGQRAAPGIDTEALDELGMRITLSYELHRLTLDGHEADFIRQGTVAGPDVDTLVVDVSTPKSVKEAEKHPIVKSVMRELESAGVSRVHPGCDVITIVDGNIDRLIELKSSGVDSRVQTMSWNEWKSAANSELRSRFWLYLVGNLRADLDASPYVRSINNPFGELTSREVHERQTRRAVQLRVREFSAADHLDLDVRTRGS